MPKNAIKRGVSTTQKIIIIIKIIIIKIVVHDSVISSIQNTVPK